MIPGEQHQEILKNFLQAYFHQDIETSEAALTALLKEETPLYLSEVAAAANSFLASNLTMEEKNKFISSNCDLHFPALNKTPVAWLEKVIQRIQSTLDKSHE